MTPGAGKQNALLVMNALVNARTEDAPTTWTKFLSRVGAMRVRAMRVLTDAGAGDTANSIY